MVQSRELAATRASASAFALRYGCIASGSRTGAGGEHDRICALHMGGDVVALEVADDRDPAVGGDVFGVSGVADQPARGMPVARQQADQTTSDLPVSACDEGIHRPRLQGRAPPDVGPSYKRPVEEGGACPAATA